MFDKINASLGEIQVLSPLEMNDIHFASGEYTMVKSTDKTAVNSAPQSSSANQ